ncbi:hypothetical protein OESDEN_02128 [Oesophagostomum dentatum]|uniref:Uncharacterized protein n=1 Tax=Oesophagostomum dentatum TaxID=61180 RepID=A0A0B1TKU3_OESDE|nr:hypothetical protein OESDEN_02128 [Oesophagostomum dentatum]
MIIIAGLVGYKKPKLIVNEMLSFLNITEHCNKAFNCCR